MGTWQRYVDSENKKEKELNTFERFQKYSPLLARSRYESNQMPTDDARRNEETYVDYAAEVSRLRSAAIDRFKAENPIPTREAPALPPAIKNNKFYQENTTKPTVYNGASEKASPYSVGMDKIVAGITGKPSSERQSAIDKALAPYLQQRATDQTNYFGEKDISEKPVSMMSDEEKQALKDEYESYEDKNFFQRRADLIYNDEYERKQALYPNYREVKNEDAYKALISHGMTEDEIKLLNESPISEEEAGLLRAQGMSDRQIESLSEERIAAQQNARTKFENLVNSVDESWDVTAEDLTNMVEDRYANPEIEKEALRSPISSSAFTLATNPVESAYSVGANVYNYVTGKPMRDYNTYTDLTRNTITENIDNQFGRTVYGGAMSIGDMAVAAGLAYATGGGSIVSGGVQALEKASQVMDEGIERNLTPDQIFAEGVASGVTTYVTEKIPMGKLEDIAEKGLTEYTKKEIGKTLGAMFLTEGLQEASEDVADWVMDRVVAMDNNEFDADVQNYINQGMSKKEAILKVISDRGVEMLTDFVIGGIGGGTMGGAASGIAYTTGKIQNKPSVYTDKVMNSENALNEMREAVNNIDTTNLEGEDLERVEHAKEVANKEEYTKEDVVDMANVLNEQASPENDLADTINNINYQASVDQNLKEYSENKTITPTEGETDIEKAARNKAESIVVEMEKSQREALKNREKALQDYKIKGLKSELGKSLNNIAQDFENEAAAKNFLENYNGQNALWYADASLQAYHAGESGQSFENFLKNSQEANLLLNEGKTTEAYLKTLFYNGQNARTEDYSTDFKVAKNPNRGLATGRKDELAPLKEKVAKALGVEVATDFEDAVQRGDFAVALAKITVSANSDNQYAALMHEVFEFARAYNPKGMAVAEKTIVKMLVAKTGERAFVDAVNRYKEAYRKAGREAQEGSSLKSEENKTFSEATEEFVNDAISYIFSTDEGIKSLTDFLMNDETTTKEEKVSAIQAIKDFVDHLIKTIRNFIKGHKTKQLGYEYARLANFSTEELENISRYLTGVLQGAKEELAKKTETSEKAENTTKTSENANKVSNLEVSTDELNKNLHIAHSMKPIGSVEFYNYTKKKFSEAADELLKQIGKTGKEYVIVDRLGKVDIDRSGMYDIVRHGKPEVSASLINAVIPVLENGKIVYADYDHKNKNFNTATIVAPVEFSNDGFGKNVKGTYYVAVVVKRSPSANVRNQALHVADILTIRKGLPRSGQSNNGVIPNAANLSLNDILEHVAADVNIFGDEGTVKFSLSVPVETNQESTQDRINASMTMDQCKDMIQRAFVSGDIKDYYEGEVKNADEWLAQDGAEVVAITVENDYAIYQKFLSKIEGLDDDFVVEDIIKAYQNGTLTGGKNTKTETKRLDVSKEGRKNDQRFYAPKTIEDYKKMYELANTKVTNKNREDVTKARAAILLFAHNKGASEQLGITEKDLNKALRNWGGYSAKAREISMRINSGASVENRWTGIENMAWLNRASVSNKELDNICGDIKGDSNETQRAYIVRTMCALDTHIDYKGLNFIFSNESLRDSNVRGEYANWENTITVRPNYPNTVAHEMGHYVDYLWGREVSGGKLNMALTELVRTQKDFGSEDLNTWANNFANFLESLEEVSSLRSSYTMNPKEVFARFVSKFVQWADAIANGENRSFHETEFYNDKFTTSQFLEFARLLQEKSALNLAEQEVITKKFSLDVPIEQTKDLIAVHNLSDEKLKGVLELGGFPMPSIAITKAKMDHSKYGSISVVFRKDTIDPKQSRYNKVYSGDAYTPTFPAVEYKIDSDKVWDVEKKVKDILGKDYGSIGYSSIDPDNVSDSLNRWNGDYAEAFENNYTLKQAFLKDNGIDVELKYTEEPIFSKLDNDELAILNDRFLNREYLEEISHDYEYGNKHPEELKKIRDLINEVVAMNNQDEIEEALKNYRETGKKRYKTFADDLSNYLDDTSFSSFDLRNFANALLRYRAQGRKKVVDQYKSRDEIKKAMEGREEEYKKWLNNLFDGVIEKKGLRNNKDMFTPSGSRRKWEVLHDDYNLTNIVDLMRKEPATGQSFGGYSFFGSATREFDSIEDIKSESNRLYIMEDALFTEEEKKIQEELYEIASRIKPSGSWDSSSAVSDIAEAVSKYKTKSGIKNFLSKWYKVSDSDIESIMVLAKKAKELPTGYFEAKPQRAVRLDEVAAIVIPSDDTEMINEVKEKGIPVVEYQRGDKQSRIDAVNSVEDIHFSLSVTVDSEGRALSEGQQKRYANDDPNLFDKNGNLKRYYHGTQRAGFTTFEIADDKISYFFTDNKKVAETYSGVSIFENPDTPMTIDQINESMWQVNGTDDEEQYFKEAAGKVEYWDMEGGDLTLQRTFDSVKDAQDWFVDEYITPLVYEDRANPSNYEVYLKATNPFVVDAKGENWNHLPPLKPYARHLQNVEIETTSTGLKITYEEDGVQKTDSTANYDYYEDKFYDAYGIDIDEQTQIFQYDYIDIRDIYYDADGKRMEQYAKTRDYSQYAYENGYDSLIFNNLVDNGFFGGFNNKETSQVVVVFNSNQAKSIYNLNPTDDPDIRHSVDVQDDAFFEAFQEVDEKVKLDESDLEQFIKNGDIDSEVTQKAVREVASNIKKQYNSNVKVDSLAADIKSVFRYLKSTGKMSMKDIMFVMKEIARPVLEDVKSTDPEQEKMYKSFINKLKGYKISLDAGQMNEVAHSFGSYYEFVRAMSGKMNLSKNGTPLDNVWTELCDISDGHLSYGTNPNDQPLALAEYIYGLKPSYQTMDGETLDDAATDLALEIFRQFYVYQSMTDAASKVKGELNRRANEYKNTYKKAYNEALKQVEAERNLNIERLAKELDNLTAEEQEALRTGDALNKAMIENLKADYQRRLDRLRAQSNQKIAQEKAKYQNAWITKNLRREKSELKNRVLREVKALQNLIAHPSEGATKHVPINLIKPTIEMLEAINLDNGGRNKAIAERLKKMSEVYESFKNDDKYSFDYDERIANDIKELREMFENKSYADLEILELERVIEIVTALKTQIKNANNLILQGKHADAQIMATRAMEEVKGSRRYDNAAMNVLNRYANVHLNAYRLFRKLSGYKDGALMDIYEDLDNGSKQEMQIQKDLGAIFQNVLEGKENQKEVKKFISTKKEDLVDIGITDKKGNPILITRAMRMSLIMHSMNEGNMRHVLGSGITIPNMYYFEKGKMDEAYAKGINYRFVDYNELLEAIQKNDVNKIKELTEKAQKRIEDMKNDLSEWEKKFLEDAEEMFHEKTGKYINDTSLALKGYVIARVKNYFPIKTDSHFTTQDWSGLIQNGSLEGSGVLKERVISTKPILLEDITNVIERQIRFTSKYAGLAIAIRNFETLMKQTSLMGGQLHNLYETIDSVWGASDTKWLRNLMQDLQGGRSEAKSWLMNLRGQFAGATLSMNPSVAIKQAASYPTAAAVVGYKALGKAMADMRKGFITQEGIKELEEINPLLWYRNQGNGTQELADAKSVGFGKNLPLWMQKAINWTQWFDTGTVRTLEYASKYYVDENFPKLEKGSEEYWNKVSEIFTNVVEQTQPNYSTLHKADIIRNPNSFVKMLVMFKTQPMQNFGIIYDALGELNAAKASNNLLWEKKAANKAALAISSQAVSATVFSAMTILSQLLLHRWWKYRDDEGKWSWEKFWVALGEGALSCFTGAFIGGSELYEALKHIFTGSSYYGIEVSVAEMVNDFVESVGNLTKNAKALWDAKTEADKETAAQKLLKYSINLGSTVGEFKGTPVNNIKNMLSAMYYYATDIVNSIDEGELSISDDSNLTSWEIETQYERIYQSLNDPERYDKLVNELKDKAKADNPDLTEDEITKKVEDAVTSKISSLIKAGYLEGEVSYEEAEKYLEEEKGKSEDEAFFQIREWETGESTYGVLKNSISEAAKDPTPENRKAMIDEINVLLEHGKEKGDIAKTVTSAFKPEYIELYNQNKAADLNSILRAAYVSMGYTDEEAKKKISDWVK